MKIWKQNWEETKQHYIDWWHGKGLVISMWEHIEKEGEPYENIDNPGNPIDLNQFWFDPEWRSSYIHYKLSRSCFKADILPIANTQLGPGSLSAILGGELEGREDTIWIKPSINPPNDIIFNKENKWWKLHIDLLKSCKEKSHEHYFVGCPDLCEGLDVLCGIYGIEQIMLEMLMNPDNLSEKLQKVNNIYFEVFEEIYNIIQINGEMAYCYFSLWAPGKVTKLQCDISVMISEEDFKKFAIPYLNEQCQKIEYTLYHLDGIDAIRHLDAILEIEELKAIQWTPGEGQPQGGNKCWYDLYKKIKKSGKSIMSCWVELNELEQLIDNIGPEGLHILMNFKTEKDIDKALKIVEKFR